MPLNNDQANQTRQINSDGKKERLRGFFWAGLAGGLGGAAGHVACGPWDFAKSYRQLGGRLPFFAWAADQARSQGLRSLFRGSFPVGVSSIASPTIMMPFMCYTMDRWIAAAEEEKKKISIAPVFFCGLALSVPTALIESPAELIKLQMQRDPHGASASIVLRRLAGNEGIRVAVRSLYRGLAATWIRNLLAYGPYHATMNHFDPERNIWGSDLTDKQRIMSHWRAIGLCGTAAGISSWIVSYPIDTWKTAVQSRSLPNARFTIMEELRLDWATRPWRRGGVGGSWIGLSTALGRAAVNNFAFFIVFEGIRAQGEKTRFATAKEEIMQ